MIASKIFEAGMLIMFGLSWPAAIIKTVKAKNPAGKSLFFAWLILCGYTSGIFYKFSQNSWAVTPTLQNWVFWCYVANLLLVAIDTALVLHYRKTKAREL